ncbi:glutamyl-tRNA amidotransferase subunit A (amidase) [Colletotrichum tofieldiae]|uniref:Glutamyl-tRNA amidotransferase subunit A (Amidase) n=1 Tax=Colletotrichum tofieldiae TaxID=708197 RepID=A0A166LKE0_9PEZI|nr:glutamyl-tRNA amidotransferase subunit A (amidase) [Colletotrichum tofieldiae]
MGRHNHFTISASWASSRIEAGTLTMVEYVSSLLGRYEAWDQQVQAWATIEPGSIIQQAREIDQIPSEQRGCLHGFVIGVKDAIHTKDLPTRHGSPIYATDGPLYDASCVTLLRMHGALIMGKTTTTEFTATFEGPGTKNPHDLNRTPGGSSSGSAAAVADLQVPIALCTQTVGSTIRPASYTGIYTFKPTWNTVSPEGQKVTSLTLDTFTVISRSVEDLQQLTDGLALCDVKPPLPLSEMLKDSRFAMVKTSQWPNAGPATIEAMDRATRILRQAGAHVTKLTLPVEFNDVFHLQNEVLGNEIGTALHYEFKTYGHLMSGDLSQILSIVDTGSKQAYLDALNTIAVLRPRFDKIASSFTAVVTPNAVDVAPVGTHTGSSDFNAMWTALHVPVIHIPGFQGEDGLPVGLSIVTASFKDRHLLQVAKLIGQLFAREGRSMRATCTPVMPADVTESRR